MLPSRSGEGSAGTFTASACCLFWIASNRVSRASIASARSRSDCVLVCAAASRSRSRNCARFHCSFGPATASESARSMSANSSVTPTAPPLVAATGPGRGAASNTPVPIGSQPEKSRFESGTGSSVGGSMAAVGSGTAASRASLTASAIASPASLIATAASAAEAPVARSAAIPGCGTSAASSGDSSRSASRAQRNSPAGGSIRAQSPACRPAAIRTWSITSTRSPASRLTCATCRRSLSCEPIRETAPSATITPVYEPRAAAVGTFAGCSPSRASSSTSAARIQLKLPATGRTAQYPEPSVSTDQTSTA